MMVRGECYPLPTWADAIGATAFGERSGDVIEYLTPCENGLEGCANGMTPEERRAMSSHLTGGKDTDTANCLLLNPDWVEWMMGWPLGWTDIAITSGVFYWLDLSDDPADWTPPLMARITTRKKHRAPRIETLGNGQVPLCAVIAFVFGFEILEVASAMCQAEFQKESRQ